MSSRILPGRRREDHPADPIASEQRWVMVEAGPQILPELDRSLRPMRPRGFASAASRFGHPPAWSGSMRCRLSVRRRGAPDRDAGVDRGREGSPSVTTLSACRSTSGVASGRPHTPGRGGARYVGGRGFAAVPDRARCRGTSPPTAQHALRQARVLAENVVATLEGGTLRSRSATRTRGCCVRSGHYRGVANPIGVRDHWVPCVVPAPHVSPGVHADVVAQGTDRAGLDRRLAVSARHRAARFARASSRRLPTRSRRGLSARLAAMRPRRDAARRRRDTPRSSRSAG